MTNHRGAAVSNVELEETILQGTPCQQGVATETWNRQGGLQALKISPQVSRVWREVNQELLHDLSMEVLKRPVDMH